MNQHDLTDFEWRAIQPHLPNRPRGVPRVDDRRVLVAARRLNDEPVDVGVVEQEHADLPARYGPPTSSHSAKAARIGFPVYQALRQIDYAAEQGKGRHNP